MASRESAEQAFRDALDKGAALGDYKGEAAQESAGSNQTTSPATGSLRERAQQRAQEKFFDGERFARLAQRLTPEIEAAIWCYQEAVALGLLNDVLQRAERRYDKPRW